MVQIIVEDDFIPKPVPIAAKSNVKLRHAPVPVIEPETLRPATANPPMMRGTKPTVKASMLPRMVQAIVGIIAPCVMPNPLIVFIHVRRIRVAGLVSVVAPLILIVLLGSLGALAFHVALAMLRRRAWGCAVIRFRPARRRRGRRTGVFFLRPLSKCRQ